jgi:hypothetical protein
MIKGIIYCATSPEGKKYYGRTIQGLKKRKYSHYAAVRSGSNLYFHNAIRKYGESNIKWEIIEERKNENSEKLIQILNEREIFYIDRDNTIRPDGYNLTKGGGNYTISNLGIRKGKTFEEIFGEEKAKEIKKKQSIGRRGIGIGRIQSEEEKNKRAKSNTGKTRKQETKDKIRNSLLDVKHTEERKQNISKSLQGKHFAQNFGPPRYGKDNTAYKDVSKEDEDLIVDLYVNKRMGSRKIEKAFDNKYSFIKILKILRNKGVYDPDRFKRK